MRTASLIFFLLLTMNGFSQFIVSGTVIDETGTPVPFAKIYIKNDAENRTLTDNKGHFELQLFEGEYFLITQMMGYDPTETYIAITNKHITQNIQIFPLSILEIENVEVSAKKSNPGREIILKVVKNRDKMNPWKRPHTVDVSIKATEQIERTEKDKEGKKKKKKEKVEVEQRLPEDPFEDAKKENDSIANNMNLVEIDLSRSWGGKHKVKEIRNAYKLTGSKENELYYLSTIKSNFNFFENLVLVEDLHQTPIGSPISGPGILSYKYRLVEQYEEEGQKIHKIEIIARNTASTTLSGFIYVIDSVWQVQKLELTMEKGNLLFYDYFSIEQDYETVQDTLCVLRKQTLKYGVKFKKSNSTCVTVANFDNYNFSPELPEKYFNNELSVTEQEAYDRDSSYWAKQRKIELTPEEIKFIKIKDSIYNYTHRKEYLDSIDQSFNKVTALKVLWFGIDHRNRAKKIQWTFNSVAMSVEPLMIAGPRFAPGFDYFKKWESGRTLDGYSEISIGFVNWDVKGSTNWEYVYDPFRLSSVRSSFSHGFDVIRAYDAITQIYKRDNFIEATSMSVGYSTEILNGLYIDADYEFTERRSLIGYKFLNTDDILPNNDPTIFETYQAGIFSATLSFIPQQKYMREPNRKVILGSKWPTFYIYYEKGIHTLFGSDVDHDYLLGGIMHTFKIGTIGTSKYHIKSGAFLSKRALYDADQKFHRRSDPIWFSNPLHSFQALDSTLPTTKIYYEGHFVHHDNGAILNKIPFMKKTRIGMVVGFGALYVPEFDWQHYEIIFGIERNFKLFKRWSRLRVGIYTTMAYGNHINPRMNWKISFATLNKRNMKWNF